MGRHAIVIVLLGIGTCVAVLTGRRNVTLAVGTLAVASAVVCGVPDGIFGTGEHLLLIASIAAVAGAAASALAGNSTRDRNSPEPPMAIAPRLREDDPLRSI